MYAHGLCELGIRELTSFQLLGCKLWANNWPREKARVTQLTGSCMAHAGIENVLMLHQIVHVHLLQDAFGYCIIFRQRS